MNFKRNFLGTLMMLVLANFSIASHIDCHNQEQAFKLHFQFESDERILDPKVTIAGRMYHLDVDSVYISQLNPKTVEITFSEHGHEFGILKLAKDAILNDQTFGAQLVGSYRGTIILECLMNGGSLPQ